MENVKAKWNLFKLSFLCISIFPATVVCNYIFGHDLLAPFLFPPQSVLKFSLTNYENKHTFFLTGVSSLLPFGHRSRMLGQMEKVLLKD